MPEFDSSFEVFCLCKTILWDPFYPCSSASTYDIQGHRNVKKLGGDKWPVMSKPRGYIGGGARPKVFDRSVNPI